MTNKVLLIEDDRTMLTLLGTLLRLEGYEILRLESEESLDEIIAYLRENKPDLILLDVNLRKVNGFDVLRTLRRDRELQHTRVIMTSGMDYSERCKKEGADGFILKPYMPEDLIEQIRLNLQDSIAH